MKYLLAILLSLTLAGCGNPLTRLLPKLEKLEVDPDLMKPPQELKLIVKPSSEEVAKILAEREKKQLEAEQEAKEAAENVSPK
jgi:hypothetical protein